MSDNRVNFTKKTRKVLIDSVGANCVFEFPACCKPLTAYDPESEKVKSIAIAAHAAAASPGGARWEKEYTEAQIKAFSNGVVLCPTHATEVDVYERRYPISMMQGWQSKAVAHRQAGTPAHRPFAESIEGNQRAVAAARLFMQFADKCHFDMDTPNLSIVSFNQMFTLISSWERDLSASNALHAGYPKLFQYQQLVVDAYRYIRNEVVGQFWYRNDNFQAYCTRIDRTYPVTAEQQAINDGAGASVEVVRAWWRKAVNARDALRRVAAGLDQPMFPNQL